MGLRQFPRGWIGDEETENPLADVGVGEWAEDITTERQPLGSNRGSGGNKNNTTARPSSGTVDGPATANSGGADVNIVCESLNEVGIQADKVKEVSSAAIRGYVRVRLKL